MEAEAEVPHAMARALEEGKLGDLVIWDAPDLDYICYRVGSNLAKTVIKRGEIV